MAIALTTLQHSRIEEASKTTLQAFQRKIYLKAKTNPEYKFYCLYDKVFRKDTLEEAYKRVKANRGAPGVDGITFDDLKDQEAAFLETLQTELKQKTYRPSALRAVAIPKRNGTMRTLRIPTIKDRVVQMAVKLIIEPIFEADFKDCSYGYRPKRSAHDEIRKLGVLLFKDIYAQEKKTMQSIDLSNCFDTIPHRELMRCIGRRVIDRELLKLIKALLKAGVMNETIGTPQGGVASPLLANIYLDRIDTYWENHFSHSTLFRYADDMVAVLTADEAQSFHGFLNYIEQELKLLINREKSRVATTKEGIDCLGFTLREKTSRRQKRYLSIEPTREAMNRIRERVRTIVRWNNGASTADTIERVNTLLRGWQHYFDNICMGRTRYDINDFVKQRVAKMISRRNKRRDITWKLFADRALYEKYGLYKLNNLGRKFA